MKGLTIEQMEFLVNKGLSGEEMLAFAKMGGAKSKGAERTARWRARKHGGVTNGVTSDVTGDASPPPMNNTSTPPVSSDEETKPAAKTKPAKPEGVSDQVWSDFTAHRRAKKAPVTGTVVAGIEREAAKAGWSLEDALAETVTRGWQAFKAEWVAEANHGSRPRDGPGGGENSFFGHMKAKQAQAAR